ANHLLDVSALLAPLPAGSQFLGERVALEPLEDHVRNQRADRGSHRRAGRDGPRDVKRAAREAGVDLAFVAKATNEGLDERRPELGLELQALDGNGLVEPNVLAPVDDTEPALSDDAIHAELSVENLPHQAVDVRRSHGRTIHMLGPAARGI